LPIPSFGVAATMHDRSGPLLGVDAAIRSRTLYRKRVFTCHREWWVVFENRSFSSLLPDSES
jgi:hypothetical protein